MSSILNAPPPSMNSVAQVSVEFLTVLSTTYLVAQLGQLRILLHSHRASSPFCPFLQDVEDGVQAGPRAA